MTDLVEIIENHCTNLNWYFSYGNKSNQNLLQSDRVEGQVYLLLDPITREKAKGEYGGSGVITFSGQFLLVVKSNLDNVYHNQKGVEKINGKYEQNIKPLLTSLELLEDEIDCSNYNIDSWQIIDVVNALDVNTDGLLVTFKISVL